MDQIKIGTFIAANRKRLGLTQVQLAEQLGVSNKSVSKWERGVCLPDVSLYQPLCEILDITLTEFFAGEKLSEETLVQRTEETIMEVSMKGKQNVDKLKKWLIAASVIVLGLLLCILYFFYKTGGFYQNMIWKAPVRSEEMQVAELATGTDPVSAPHRPPPPFPQEQRDLRHDAGSHAGIYGPVRKLRAGESTEGPCGTDGTERL